MLCYPEGNFGGNQLLDGSIGLSPLYPDVTIDLHVRTVAGLHQRFLLASPSPGIVHHLSGLIRLAHVDVLLEISMTDIKSVLCRCSAPSGLSIHQTCEPDNLLGPCFKTGPMRLDFTLINHECCHPGRGSSGTNGGFLPRHVSLIGFPTNDFTRYLHALYKVLFKLPSRYFCAITSLLYLVFDGMYHHRFRLHSQTVLLHGEAQSKRRSSAAYPG